MNINRFTEKTQEALREAQGLASRRQHQGIDAEHLLSAILTPTDGLGRAFLQASGANVDAL